jgi:hypothetical protein
MVSFEQAVTQQLCGVLNELKKIRMLEEKKESRDVGVVYIAIPENAGTRSFSIGATKINFISGSITNPDGSTEQIHVSLGRLGKDFLHSLSLTSDQDIILQIGSGGKKTVQSNLSMELPYATFNEITITTTQTANISIYASTNPFSTVNGNTVSIMKGQNAGSLVTVALDANGNILGVLKGDYGGTLKTLATDADGRLLAKIYDPQNIFGVNLNVGLAEHSQRIGIPLLYDKRGEIFWYDDFESPTVLGKWNVTEYGIGGSVSIDTTRSHTGDQCVKMISGTGVVDWGVDMEHYEGTLGSTRVGISCCIQFNNCTDTQELFINILNDSNPPSREACILIDATNGTLSYYGSDYAYHIFASGFSPPYGSFGWLPFKAVFDFATGKYVRCIFLGVEYDLSAYSMPDAPAQDANILYATILLQGSDTTSATVWIDDLVLTCNEV